MESETLKGLRHIEVTAWIIGIVLVIGSWLVGSQKMAFGAALGALFASINFRLLIWSWSSYVDVQVQLNQTEDAEQSETIEQMKKSETTDAMGFLPKFVIKYTFLLIGIFLLVSGLQLHLTGCLIGMGNVIIAASLSPLVFRWFPQAPQAEQG